MKFGEYLLNNRISDWAAWYIDYELLKNDIKVAKTLLPQIQALCGMQNVNFVIRINKDAPFEFRIFKMKITPPGKDSLDVYTVINNDQELLHIGDARTDAHGTGVAPTHTDSPAAAPASSDVQSAKVLISPRTRKQLGADAAPEDYGADAQVSTDVQLVPITTPGVEQQRRSNVNIIGFHDKVETPQTMGRGWQRAVLAFGDEGYSFRAPDNASRTVTFGQSTASFAEFLNGHPFDSDMELIGQLAPAEARRLLQELIAAYAGEQPLRPEIVKFTPASTPKATDSNSGGASSPVLHEQQLVSSARIFPGIASFCDLQMSFAASRAALSEASIAKAPLQLAAFLFQHQINERFRRHWLEQITKVETFYNRESQLIATAAVACIDTVKKYKLMKAEERAQLRTAFRQILHLLDNLQRYCDMNTQAVAKILKKFDKVTHQDTLLAYKHVFPNMSFATGHPSRIQQLKEDLTEAYSTFICDGNRKQAITHLFLKDQTQELSEQIPVASLASAMGACALLLCVLAIMEVASLPQPIQVDYGENSSYLISVTGTLLLLPLLFSFNVLLWSRYNINYAFMFELDVDCSWNFALILRGGLTYALIWAACTYAFARAAAGELSCDPGHTRRATSAIPAWVFPYLIVPLWTTWFLIRYFTRDKRRQHVHQWLIRSTLRILATPAFRVTFSDFFIADQLTSMTSVLYQLQFCWCVFHWEAVEASCTAGRGMGVFAAAVLPNIWRCLQCISRYREPAPEDRKLFPHIINAVKYSSTIAAQVASFIYSLARYRSTDVENDSNVRAAMIAYLTIELLSTIYKSFWDTFVDFAVVRVTTWRFREELVYGSPWIYIGVCAVNLVLRCAWLVSFGIGRVVRAEWTFPLFASIEITRRAIWNCFRIENEQVSNIESYRATLLAPLPKRHVDDSLWSSNAAEIGKRFAHGADTVAETEEVRHSGIHTSNWSSITRVFASLPEKEKIEILKIAIPTRKFQDKKYSGKSKTFSELAEETKVHAVLQRLGARTVAEYALSFDL